MADNEETTEEKAPESTDDSATEKPAPAEKSAATASSSLDDVKVHALGLIDTITDKVKSLIAGFTEKKPNAPAEESTSAEAEAKPAEAEEKPEEDAKSDDEVKSGEEEKPEGEAKPDA